MKKVIVIKATNTQINFGATAAETHRILTKAGVEIGKSTVKLIQNGTKTSACGIEVVELKEETKKIKVKRSSKVWAYLTEQTPELNKIKEAGFSISGTKIIGGQRFDAIKGEVRLSVNLGKRGCSLIEVSNNKARTVYPTVADLIEAIIAK